MQGGIFCYFVFYFPSVIKKSWVSSSRKKCGILCSTKCTVDLVSKRNMGAQPPALLMTINLLMPWKRKREGDFLVQMLPEIDSFAGKAEDNRLKSGPLQSLYSDGLRTFAELLVTLNIS